MSAPDPTMWLDEAAEVNPRTMMTALGAAARRTQETIAADIFNTVMGNHATTTATANTAVFDTPVWTAPRPTWHAMTAEVTGPRATPLVPVRDTRTEFQSRFDEGAGIIKGPFAGCKCETHHMHGVRGASGCPVCNPVQISERDERQKKAKAEQEREARRRKQMYTMNAGSATAHGWAAEQPDQLLVPPQLVAQAREMIQNEFHATRAQREIIRAQARENLNVSDWIVENGAWLTDRTS